MSCMTIHFSKLANHQTRHQAYIKWGVRLVIAYCHFNLPRGGGGVGEGMYGFTTLVYILTSLPPKVLEVRAGAE